MRKHELLVPAGNMECLKQAVYNGCDAVYLACKSFGARKFANNFTNDEILEAIKFCHLYGVKVFVTMNILVKNSEVESFLEQVRFLHKNGVDALIVQDFGMICLLREKFPNLEIHASTQANISSIDVCKLYSKLGVKRVVFSREIPIDDIDKIDVPIEKEAFIHGALCISYSGCCLMSSMLGGRSGNRGECAGSCRMPFTLKKGDITIAKDKYLLSTKELNTSGNIKRLLDSSIYSFKIEGRMKSPLYVGFITSFYRKLIDGDEFNYEEEMNKLKTIFNREFTCGRIFSASDKDLMNIDSPNHKGLEIGKVIGVTPKKIKIKLNDGFKLNQYDAIRFYNAQEGFIVNYLYDDKDRLINSSDNICYVDNNVSLKENDIIYKTQDYLLSQEYILDAKKRKIEVCYEVKAKIGDKLFIRISDGEFNIEEYGGIVEKSINSPTTEVNIRNQLSKLGNTPFICDNYDVDMDSDVFISLKELNEIRRSLVEKLINMRQNRDVSFVERNISFNLDEDDISIKNVYCVYTDAQLDVCKKKKNSILVVCEKGLYQKNKDHIPNLYYLIPRETFDICSSLVSQSMVSDYADYNGFDVIGNYSLNVMNIYTAYYLKKIGIKNICLSVELSEDELLEFNDLYAKKFGKQKFTILAGGRIENMIIKGNVLDLNSSEKYDLIDFKNRDFPVFYDGVNTHILNYISRNVDLKKVNNEFNLRYDFYYESSEEINNLI